MKDMRLHQTIGFQDGFSWEAAKAAPNEAWYDYDRQAWVKDGVYQRCAHPEEMACGCYGRAHAGEKAVSA